MHVCVCLYICVSVCACVCIACASVAGAGLRSPLSVGQLGKSGGYRRQQGLFPAGLCVSGAVGRGRVMFNCGGAQGGASWLSKWCGRAVLWMVLGQNNKGWSLT